MPLKKHRQFVFKVQKQATKKQVKNAVEIMFGVEVDSVHVLNVKGKAEKSWSLIGSKIRLEKSLCKAKVWS